MKKLLLILLCLPLLFTTCKKEDDSPINSGNNGDTFLSVNDGTVWVCQEESGSSMSSFVGGDSLIGFYNATNFTYQIQRAHWSSLPFPLCNYTYEADGEENGVFEKIQIIINTPDEFVVTFESGIIGYPPTTHIIRRVTAMGENQLLNEAFFIDSLGQEIPYNTDWARTYIKSTELQNLSCN
jgi:hypothetical protein